MTKEQRVDGMVCQNHNEVEGEGTNYVEQMLDKNCV